MSTSLFSGGTSGPTTARGRYGVASGRNKGGLAGARGCSVYIKKSYIQRMQERQKSWRERETESEKKMQKRGWEKVGL